MRVTIDGRPVRFPLAGVGQYVANLATAISDLARPEVEATILLFDTLGKGNADARRLARRLDRMRVRTHRVVPRKVFTAWLRYAAPAVPAPVLGGGFDVWHATHFESHPRMAQSQRLVSTIHDVIFLSHPHLFQGRNLRASRVALSRQVKESHRIIVVSEYTRAQLLGHTDAAADRVTVIPNAVHVTPLTEEQGAAARKTLGIDRPYVLYLGNLEPRKDIPTLLRAWSMTKAHEDFALVLAGAPAYMARPIIATISAAAATHDVRWLGYVSEEEKSALLSDAEAFVYPSVYEGFGIPILEALTHGVPVVACETSSIPRVAGPGALLVAPSSPRELGEALDRLLGDAELRRRLSALGREHSSRYSWERVARETLGVYCAARES